MIMKNLILVLIERFSVVLRHANRLYMVAQKISLCSHNIILCLSEKGVEVSSSK